MTTAALSPASFQDDHVVRNCFLAGYNRTLLFQDCASRLVLAIAIKRRADSRRSASFQKRYFAYELRLQSYLVAVLVRLGRNGKCFCFLFQPLDTVRICVVVRCCDRRRKVACVMQHSTDIVDTQERRADTGFPPFVRETPAIANSRRKLHLNFPRVAERSERYVASPRLQIIPSRLILQAAARNFCIRSVRP